MVKRLNFTRTIIDLQQWPKPSLGWNQIVGGWPHLFCGIPWCYPKFLYEQKQTTKLSTKQNNWSNHQPPQPCCCFFWGDRPGIRPVLCCFFFYLAAATMKNTTCDWLDFQLPFFANLYHKQTWQQPGDQKHPKTCSNYGTSLGFQWSPFSKVLFQPPMGSHSLWLACFKGTLFQGIWLASMSLFQGYVLLPSFKGFPLPRVCVVLQVAVLFPLFSSASLARKASTASAKVAHGPSALPWFLNHMWSSHFVLMG